MKAHNKWLNEIASCLQGVRDEDLAAAAAEILRAGAVVAAGNGGSASLASHFAQAVMKPDYAAGGAARAAACVTDAAPTLTAHANDGGWPSAMLETAKPLLAAMPRAAVALFSSSGRSASVVAIAEHARTGRHPVITFTGSAGGSGGGPLRKLADVSLHVESDDYEVIEPAHDALMHRIQYHLRRLA